jgi:hypothetical protein
VLLGANNALPFHERRLAVESRPDVPHQAQ